MDMFFRRYCPDISREEAIAYLQPRQPGAFVVRDSHSFPGAFGLALRVSQPPAEATDAELVRHFLIEPTPKGVRLKGYANEPVFGSLSALIYQHTITRLALPERLMLPAPGDAPKNGPDGGQRGSLDTRSSAMQQLLAQGAACNVTYLLTLDTDALTGPVAVRKAVSKVFSSSTELSPLMIHFKVSAGGITLTDRMRRRFFRRHLAAAAVSFCALDPDGRTWTDEKGAPACAIFGLVARRHSRGGYGDNQCHVFAEKDPDQPAGAIVNFINRALLQQSQRAGVDGGGRGAAV
jgi:tensin